MLQLKHVSTICQHVFVPSVLVEMLPSITVQTSKEIVQTFHKNSNKSLIRLLSRENATPIQRLDRFKKGIQMYLVHVEARISTTETVTDYDGKVMPVNLPTFLP